MQDLCHVCGGETTEHTAAECLRCRHLFHLALRMDVPTRECGQVWIDDGTMALDFACDMCLGTTPATASSASPRAPRVRGRRRYVRREGSAAAFVRNRQT